MREDNTTERRTLKDKRLWIKSFRIKQAFLKKNECLIKIFCIYNILKSKISH